MGDDVDDIKEQALQKDLEGLDTQTAIDVLTGKIPRQEMLSVANAMIKYGGSFVKSLGNTLLQADEFNQQKIKNAFPKYCEH